MDEKLSHSEAKLTEQDFDRYDWQADIATAKSEECFDFSEIFFARFKEFEIKGDDLGVRVYYLLYKIASFSPNYEISGMRPRECFWAT